MITTNILTEVTDTRIGITTMKTIIWLCFRLSILIGEVVT